MTRTATSTATSAIERPLVHTLTLGISCNFTEQRVGVGIVFQAGNKKKRKSPLVETVGETYPCSEVPTQNLAQFAILRTLQIATERGDRRVRIRIKERLKRTPLKQDLQSGLICSQNELDCRILRLAFDFEDTQLGWCLRGKDLLATKLARQAAGIARKSQKRVEQTLSLWELGVEETIRRFEQAAMQEPWEDGQPEDDLLADDPLHEAPPTEGPWKEHPRVPEAEDPLLLDEIPW